jgi:hypothetical protein
MYIGQGYGFGRTPIHLGPTNNKPQFYLGRIECPAVSSLRQTISRMGRTMPASDRYFKAWVVVVHKTYHMHPMMK